MSAKQYPSVEYIRQCFHYENGKLFWLERPLHHFPDEHHFKCWNTRFRGKEAGGLYAGMNRWFVGIGGNGVVAFFIVTIIPEAYLAGKARWRLKLHLKHY